MDAETKKLLDNGHGILLFRNELQTYTAASFALASEVGQAILASVDDLDVGSQITDHFEPSEALKALADKTYGTGMYGNDK